MVFWICALFVLGVNSQACNSCRVALTSFQIWATNDKNKAVVASLVQDFCNQEWVPTDCEDVLTYLIPQINEAFLGSYFSPDRFCSILAACGFPEYTKENFTNYEETVMKDADEYFEPTYGQISFQFAQISDIHYDEKYVVGSSNKCSTPPCCRGSFAVGTRAGSYGDYNCDIPYSTVTLAVDFLAGQPLDFIFWTGDTSAHDSSLTKTQKLDSIKKVTDLLWSKFGNVVPVYPIFGSHDAGLVGQYNFTSNNPLSSAAANMWSKWIGTKAASSLSKYGRYSLIHRNTNLKIIAINTLACDYRNFWLLVNVTDPGENLKFLWDELKSAEQNFQFVYIIGHIPPGSDSCLSTWSKHYQVLIRRYSNIVRGQFFGHHHKDEYKLTKDKSGNPIGIQFISPSLNSFEYTNPSFRIYSADFDTKAVTNYAQYRLKLQDLATEFTLGYDFLSYYLVSDMRPKTLMAMSRLMQGDEMVSMKYVYNKFTYSSQTPSGCDVQCRSDLVCDINNDRPDYARTCKGLKQTPSEYFLSRLYGEWTIKS